MERKASDISSDDGYIGSLIREGFYDKLIIIGFPYDRGAKAVGARGGSDYGPGTLPFLTYRIQILSEGSSKRLE